jgi:hypothetical protein
MGKVASQWGEVREALAGDRNKPIHFADVSRRQLRNCKKQQKLCEFFDQADIGRIAVSLVEKQGIDLSDAHGHLVIRSVFMRLLYEHGKIVKIPFSKLAIFFEDSHIMKHVYEICKGLSLHSSDGVSVPLSFHWITKDVNAPWMEMADGIAHTWAGVVRGDPRGDFENRRRAIFAPANRAPSQSTSLDAVFSEPGK